MKKQLKEFQKAIEIDANDWYIYQTYIKLGICYTALENYELAIQNLKQGKELTSKSVSDSETKQKWLVITDLFLAEINNLS